ncbi:MAG: peptidase [Clostridiales bacterium]|jgi:hypothetical protein|nr:peptidase [Clostridiales bacterium]
MKIESILSKIPDYQTFYTVNELDEQVRILEAEYPGIVKVSEIGTSRKGHPILCMRIGEGGKNALCFACPHPNEPIGAMTLTAMARLFAENNELLKETGFTWYLIPCIDPDGTKLNEGWFKGPFSLTNYVRNFYRPVGYEQVEWTFPFDYKGICFNKPIPETQSLMKLIDELKPSFMFSLHNAAFGGAYWYLSDNIPGLCNELENTAARQNVPLQLGEPEAAYITKFSPAVHSMLSITKFYDYMEKYGGGLPEMTATCGTSSSDYVNTVCKCVSMMAELPYFSDPRIEDLSQINKTRRESALENLRLSQQHYSFLKSQWTKVSCFFGEGNPFPKFVESCIEGADSNVIARQNQLKDSEFDRPATVSEEFDNLYGTRIFECLNLALAIRACDYELTRENIENENTLIEVRAAIDFELMKMCEWLESNVKYEVISIKRLVSVQTESALLAAKYVVKEA